MTALESGGATKTARGQIAVLMAILPFPVAAAGAPALQAHFAKYFGPVDPMLAVTAIGVVGSAALAYLHVRGWSTIYAGRRTLSGVAISAVLASAFAAFAITLDLVFGFPRTLNAPWPWSTLFYPTMGFTAEMTFHVVPLALILGAVPASFAALKRRQTLSVAIVVASLLEPAFQIAAVAHDERMFARESLVFLHVLAFNVMQLRMFRRFDFVALLSFRLAYYAWWHVIWGHARLSLLF